MAKTGTFKGGDKLKLVIEDIAKKAHKGEVVSVGWFPDATEPDGQYSAFVAVVNEFGAPANGLPPRPFFRRMIQHGSPHWGEDLGKALIHYELDAKKALEAMGIQMVAELQGSIGDKVYAPLKESTVARKGNDQTLIDSHAMQNSVDFEVK